MNYIQQINLFEQFTEINNISATAQLLWYKLMQKCNRSMWQEWIQIGNISLMASLHIGEKTLIKARKELEALGLVETEKGKKGCPNKYRLIPLKNTVNNTVQKEAEQENTVENTVGNAVNNTAIYKQKHNKKKNISKDMFKERHIFILPTKEEIKEYCQEIGKKINVERFFDFYESKNWMIGRTKMRDWKASVRKWEEPNTPKENKFINFQQRDTNYDDLVANYYGFAL